MATFVQRWQSIGDALLNAVAPAAKLGRLAEAVCYSQGRLHEYQAASTNALKAEIAVQCIRGALLALVKTYEADVAVSAARQTTSATVDTDFAGAP